MAFRVGTHATWGGVRADTDRTPYPCLIQPPQEYALNSMHPAFRRLTAFAGAVLAGTAAALLLASPASAHQTMVEGTAVCDTAKGDWVVTWTVGNTEDDLEGKITGMSLKPDGTTVTNIAKDAVLPMKGKGELTGVQRVAASEKEASLSVSAQWIRDKETINHKDADTVTFTGTCAKNTATFATACDGVVTVTLDNTAGTEAAKFVVKGKDGWVVEKTVEAGKTDSSVKVPAANSAEITVSQSDTVIATGKKALPANCGGLPVTGAKAGAAAAGALGLVGAGAALFVMARRRRIRFTT